MNKIFKTVFDALRGVTVVVSESSRRHGVALGAAASLIAAVLPASAADYTGKIFITQGQRFTIEAGSTVSAPKVTDDYVISGSFTTAQARRQGGAVFLDRGYLTIGDGTVFSNNQTNVTRLIKRNDFLGGGANYYAGGGAINLFLHSTAYADAGFTSGDNVRFENNTAKGDGGAIFDNGLRTFVLGKTYFIGNTSTSGNGGALGLTDDASVAGSSTHIGAGSVFEGNSAAQNGGAIHIRGTRGNFYFGEGLTFRDNHAGLYGGALFALNGPIILPDGASFIDNSAEQDGGALFITDVAHGGEQYFHLEGGSVFNGNHASNGGAASVATRVSDTPARALFGVTSGSTSVFDGSTQFNSNRASADGGALYLSKAKLDAGSVRFENNAAGETDDGLVPGHGNGGAVYSSGAIYSSDGTAISGTTFHGGAVFRRNTAGFDGGAVFNTDGAVMSFLGEAVFESNWTAFGNGGALYNGGVIDFASGVSFSSNTALSGGAVYNTSELAFEGRTLVSGNSAENGGAFYNTGSVSFTSMNEDEADVFQNNTASGDGGAVFNTGTLNAGSMMTSFSGNTSGHLGGAVYNGAGGAAEFSGFEYDFTGNSAVSGGAVSNSGSVSFSNDSAALSFNGNSAQDRGGALFSGAPDAAADALMDVTVLGSPRFTGNSAQAGGAVYNGEGASLSFLGSSNSFEGNNARADGGAFYNAGSVRLGTEDSVGSFSGNSAQGNGGAVFNSGSFTVLSHDIGTFFEGNRASGLGGAVYNGESGVLNLGGRNSFSSNTDSSGTNDIYNDGELNLAAGNTVTTVQSGISGSGTLNLLGGRLGIDEGVHVDQGNFFAGAGTRTVVLVEDTDDIGGVARSASDISARRLAAAKAVPNGEGGYVIHASESLSVEEGAELEVGNARAGRTYLIAYTDGEMSGSDGAWAGQNLISTNPLVDFRRVSGDSEIGTVMVTSGAEDPEVVLPCVQAPANLRALAYHVDLESDSPGIRFLSRATDRLYAGSLDNMTRTVNSAVQMGELGGVKNFTRSASGLFNRSIERHLSLSGTLRLEKEGVALHEKNHSDLWADVIGQHSRRTGDAGRCVGVACEARYGLKTDIGALVAGLDRTTESGSAHWGAAFTAGGGDVDSTGGMQATGNNVDFWGAGLYGGMDSENWNLTGSISYMHFDHDIDQDLGESLGMGKKLTADARSHVFSVGAKAEYRAALDDIVTIKPYIGARWDRMTTSAFDTYAESGAVLKTQRDTQDIFSVPIGAALTISGIRTASGWAVRPAADVSVTLAAGDLKGRTRFHAADLDALDTIRTRIVDPATVSGSLSFDAQKGGASFGAAYEGAVSRNQTSHTFMAKFVYKF